MIELFIILGGMLIVGWLYTYLCLKRSELKYTKLLNDINTKLIEDINETYESIRINSSRTPDELNGLFKHTIID